MNSRMKNRPKRVMRSYLFSFIKSPRRYQGFNILEKKIVRKGIELKICMRWLHYFSIKPNRGKCI